MTSPSQVDLYAILAAGMFIGGTAGYLGSLMLGRRMALVAGPLGHLTLPGIALALVYGFDVSLGAFPFVIAGIFLIWLLEMRTHLPMEALTALVFAAGVAIAFLFLPIARAEAALIGDISRTSPLDATVAVIVCAATTAIAHHVYKALVLVNISADLAACEGIRVQRYNLIYLLLIALVVALGVRMVGGLLTAALVAIPPMTARNLARDLSQYAIGSMMLGALAALAGTLLFHFTGYAAGPLIVVVSTCLFLLSLPFAGHR